MNLDEQVKNYTLLPATAQLVKRAHIVLLAGIAGSGKDTVKKLLLENEDYQDIISHTTRPPRANNGIMERHGNEYYFISISDAAKMIEKKEFVEAKLVHGDTVYGTSTAQIQAGYDAQKISITDIDVQGVGEYKRISQNVVAIFLLPPNYDVWRERLSKRYDSMAAFEAEWPKRRASALSELERALSVPYYHFIINDDLKRTVHVADSIARNPDQFNRKDDEARLAARDILEHLKSLN